MCRSGLECFALLYDVLVIGRPSCDLVFTGLPSWPNVGREIIAHRLTVSAGGAFNAVAALHRLRLRSGLVLHGCPVSTLGIRGAPEFTPLE